MKELLHTLKNFLGRHLVKVVIMAAVVLALFTLLGDNKKTSYGTSGSYGGHAETADYDMAYSEEMEFAPQALRSSNTVSNQKAVAYSSDGGNFIAPAPNDEAAYDGEAERRLAKTGSISMVVESIADTRLKIEAATKGFGGFIANSNFNEGNGYQEYSESKMRSGNITMKVPTEQFEKTMQSLREIALKVSNENSNVQDVTEQYSDLETRIKNKEAEEKQYRALLARASKITDILEITKYVNQTRSEIERMQGQLNVLSNRTTLATISVYLESEQAFEAYGVTWDPVNKIKEAWSNLLEQLVKVINSIIAFVFWLPVLFLYVLGYGIGLMLVWKLGNWLFRKYRYLFIK